MPLVELGQTTLFLDLCELFEKVSASKSKGGHEEFQVFFNRWRQKKADIYPVLRLMVPAYDHERPRYNMKAKKLVQMYVKILAIEKTPQAERLENFSKPEYNTYEETGMSLGAAVEMVLDELTTITEAAVTIAQINDALDTLAETEVRAGAPERMAVFDFVVNNLTPMEHKWFVSIILKDLKCGVSQSGILKAFHSQAADMYSCGRSLRDIATTLYDPNARFDIGSIEPFYAIKPQQLSRVYNIAEIPELMGTAKGDDPKKCFWIEEKIDGWRMLMHMRDGKYMFTSRNQQDYTPMFGSDPNDKTKAVYYFHRALFPDTDTVGPTRNGFIIDGEMCVYDEEKNTIQQFGKLSESTGGISETGVIDLTRHPIFFVFDILYYEDTRHPEESDVRRARLEDRYALLKGLVPPRDSGNKIDGLDSWKFLQLLPHIEGRTINDVATALDQIVMDQKEGLVIKNPIKSYRLEREKQVAMKVKIEDLDMSEHLDLLVVGAYWGSGSRAGMFSSFLLAARVNGSDEFVTISNVGSGMKYEELRDITAELQHSQRLTPNNKSRQASNKPEWLQHAFAMKTQPDFWVSKEANFILEVKCGELIESTGDYASPLSLRFPRIIKRRTDKSRDEVELHSRLLKLKEDNLGRLTKPGMYNESRKKKRKLAKERTSLAYKQHLKAMEMHKLVENSIHDKSQIFEGLSIHVASVAPEAIPSTQTQRQKSKTNLQVLIRQHGAESVMTPSVGKTNYIIMDAATNPQHKRMLECQKYDIVRSQWVKRCVAARERLPILPSDVVHATPNLQKHLRKIADRFGDLYETNVKSEDLRTIFHNMAEYPMYAEFAESSLSLSRSEIKLPPIHPKQKNALLTLMAQVEEKYFFPKEELRPFRNLIVYVDMFHNVKLSTDKQSKELPFEIATEGEEVDAHTLKMSLVRNQILSLGGQVSGVLSPHVTHVVVDSTDLSRLDDILHKRVLYTPHYAVVTEKWVMESFLESTILNEDDYKPIKPRRSHTDFLTIK